MIFWNIQVHSKKPYTLFSLDNDTSRRLYVPSLKIVFDDQENQVLTDQ